MAQNSRSTMADEQRKRSAFEIYLKLNGFTDTLNEIIATLLNEPRWPEDPLGYLRDCLSKRIGFDTVTQMQTTIAELQDEMRPLKHQVIDLSIEEWLRKNGQIDDSTQAELRRAFIRRPTPYDRPPFKRFGY